MLRGVMGLVLGLAVLAGTVWVVGALQPVAHSVEAEVDLPVPADSVWAWITTPEDAPRWRPGVREVRDVERDEGLSRWTELGDDGALTFAVTDWAPARRTMRATIDTPGLPFGGSWTYRVVDRGRDGATLRIREDGEVYSPVFRFFSTFVFGHEATLRDYLAAVERRARPEAGGPRP